MTAIVFVFGYIADIECFPFEQINQFSIEDFTYCRRNTDAQEIIRSTYIFTGLVVIKYTLFCAFIRILVWGWNGINRTINTT